MSYTRSYHHIVFGTHCRLRCITRDRKERLYSYIAKIIDNNKCALIAINGMEEHVHILVNVHPTVALAELVKAIKQSSSRWITRTFSLPLFEGWAKEYFACSVSPAHVEPVKSYIMSQETHHAGKDYNMEMGEFVERMGFDRYEELT